MKNRRGNRESRIFGFFYFHFLYLFSGNCCKSVKAAFDTYNDSTGWFKPDSKFGYYELQSGLVNDKAHYITRDGKNAIWYYGGNWFVGLQIDIAADMASFKDRSTADCPDAEDWTWQYADKRTGRWSNAYKGFRIFCMD